MAPIPTLIRYEETGGNDISRFPDPILCLANKLTHFCVVTIYMLVLWLTAAFIVPEPNNVTITSYLVFLYMYMVTVSNNKCKCHVYITRTNHILIILCCVMLQIRSAGTHSCMATVYNKCGI